MSQFVDGTGYANAPRGISAITKAAIACRKNLIQQLRLKNVIGGIS
jgi:hypothetical protein